MEVLIFHDLRSGVGHARIVAHKFVMSLTHTFANTNSCAVTHKCNTHYKWNHSDNTFVQHLRFLEKENAKFVNIAGTKSL